MSMKLSYRDKVIIIIVICIIVLILGFVFIVRPMIANLETERSTLSDKQAEQQRVHDKVNTLGELVGTLTQTADDIDVIQENFYVEAQPYEFEQLITEKLRGQDIEIRSINTTYAYAGDISKYTVGVSHALAYQMKMDADIYTELPQAVYDRWSDIETPEAPTVRIGVTTVTVSFMASAGSAALMGCIDELAEDEKSIIVYSAVSDTNETQLDEAGQSENSINITVYSIVPLNTELVDEDAEALQEIHDIPIPEIVTFEE